MLSKDAMMIFARICDLANAGLEEVSMTMLAMSTDSYTTGEVRNSLDSVRKLLYSIRNHSEVGQQEAAKDGNRVLDPS